MNSTDYDIFFSDDDEISMSINSTITTNIPASLESQKKDGEVSILREKVDKMEREHFITLNKMSQKIIEMKKEFEQLSMGKEKELERLKTESSFRENEISFRMPPPPPQSQSQQTLMKQNPPNFDIDLLLKPKKVKVTDTDTPSGQMRGRSQEIQKDSIHTIMNRIHHLFIKMANISKEDKKIISECRDLLEKYFGDDADKSDDLIIYNLLKIINDGSYGRKIILLPFILSLILESSINFETPFFPKSLPIIEEILIGNGDKSKLTFIICLKIMIKINGGTLVVRDDFINGGRIFDTFLMRFFSNTLQDIYLFGELIFLIQKSFLQGGISPFSSSRVVRVTEQINQFLRNIIGNQKFKRVQSLIFECVVFQFWKLKIAPIGLLLEPQTLRLLVRNLYNNHKNSSPPLIIPILHEWICVEKAPIRQLLGREIFNLSRFISTLLLENSSSLVLQRLDSLITDSLLGR